MATTFSKTQYAGSFALDAATIAKFKAIEDFASIFNEVFKKAGISNVALKSSLEKSLIIPKNFCDFSQTKFTDDSKATIPDLKDLAVIPTANGFSLSWTNTFTGNVIAFACCQPEKQVIVSSVVPASSKSLLIPISGLDKQYEILAFAFQ